jgi:hypothetical protein
MGITGCCNKSENRKYHQLPRDFNPKVDKNVHDNPTLQPAGFLLKGIFAPLI